METELTTSAIRLSAALLAGALIGVERTYHGRPAGFRTHILVCTASSLLMLMMVFPDEVIGDTPLEVVRIDPTRMAQGIMTGIGFLGAGVILKDNLAVRGLTTAASIWITASIGIMIGIGLYYAAGSAVVVVLVALSSFRWIESKVPSLHYSRLEIRQSPDDFIPETELTTMINSHGIACAGTSYHLDGQVFRYEITVQTRDPDNYRRLAETLQGMSQIEFSITRTGN